VESKGLGKQFLQKEDFFFFFFFGATGRVEQLGLTS
jgi:hypothetical protein